MAWKSTTDSWSDLFEKADELGNSEEATREAWARAMDGESAACEGRTPQRQHADQLIALDAYALDWARKGGKWRPAGKRSIGIGRVLVDLDQLEPALLSSSEWRQLAERLDDVAQASELFERAELLTETSSTGVQLVVRLRGFYWDSRAFFRCQVVRAELERVGEQLRAIVGRGGLVDRSAFASGRWARRPGVRVKAGAVEHARLRWVGAPSNVVQLAAVRRERECRAV